MTPALKKSKKANVVIRLKSNKKTLRQEPEKKVAPPHEFIHQPVMMGEVRDGLGLGIEKRGKSKSQSESPKKVMVDGTLGLGGHARMILEGMGEHGRLIGFDLDEGNLKKARENLKVFGKQVVFIQNNFSTLSDVLKKLKIKSVDGILLDLGISSVHVDDPEKGFSFMKEGPLDMRYGKIQTLTAAEVINKYSHKELMRIFKEYGEERYAWKVAQEIVARRRRHPFVTTLDLANCVEKILKRQGHIHPATRIFQAVRIEVNHELDVLQSILAQAVGLLKKGGRIVVISYHSLEDRVVKQFFLAHARDYINLPHEMTTTHLIPTLKILTKKPLVPSAAELQLNPRSRSAKLRVAERI